MGQVITLYALLTKALNYMPLQIDIYLQAFTK